MAGDFEIGRELSFPERLLSGADAVEGVVLSVLPRPRLDVIGTNPTESRLIC
jgi:hypothetical protein